jgi:hypothetical protein
MKRLAAALALLASASTACRPSLEQAQTESAAIRTANARDEDAAFARALAALNVVPMDAPRGLLVLGPEKHSLATTEEQGGAMDSAELEWSVADGPTVRATAAGWRRFYLLNEPIDVKISASRTALLVPVSPGVRLAQRLDGRVVRLKPNPMSTGMKVIRARGVCGGGGPGSGRDGNQAVPAFVLERHTTTELDTVDVSFPVTSVAIECDRTNPS